MPPCGLKKKRWVGPVPEGRGPYRKGGGVLLCGDLGGGSGEGGGIRGREGVSPLTHGRGTLLWRQDAKPSKREPSMNMLQLTRLEQEITRLPEDEQLWLVERLTHCLKRSSRPSEEGAQLAAMAADPEIVRELRTIDREFAVAEADGLGEL